MSRPTKRLKLDNELLLTSNGINKLLNRLDKPSLCSLALTWLAQQQSTDSTPPTEDSSEEEEDSEEQEGNKRVMYEDMRDDTAVSKAKVIKRIQRDWVSSPLPSVACQEYADASLPATRLHLSPSGSTRRAMWADWARLSLRPSV